MKNLLNYKQYLILEKGSAGPSKSWANVKKVK